jgi:hypothetical protein
MKNLIDRYLYDVTKRLPEKIRGDVERELRSNIEDMLSDDPSDAEIESVLTKLGSPAKLAVSYHPNPRYLISPEYFDDYLSVLKIAAFALAVILAAVSVFRLIFADEITGGVADTIASILGSFVSGAATGAVHAFLWVTLAFALFEFFSNKEKPLQWTPKLLPNIPANNSVVIKRSETVTGAMFSLLFTVIFLVGTLGEPRFIALYESGVPAAPVFNEQVMRSFLPLYVFLMVLMLFVAVVKFIKGRWTLLVAVSQILYSIFSAAVGISLINRPDFLGDAFVSRFAGILNITRPALVGYVDIAFTVITVLIVVGTGAEIIGTIVKTAKGSRLASAGVNTADV